MNKLVFAGILLLFFKINAQDIVPKLILDHIESIDSNKIKNHVAFLADDKLQGRYPGKPGYQMAVDYIVDQFRSMGLKPSGENDTFLQKVIIRNSKLVFEKSEIFINAPNGKSRKLVIGNDLIIFPHPEKITIDINAPLVFVGAGFNAPKFGLDDYRGVDVKGKIVVIMRKTPENISENVKRHLTYNSTYQDYAAKNGAIGVLLCNYSNSVAQFKSAGKTIMSKGLDASINKNGTRAGSSNMVGGKIQFMGRITLELLKEIMGTETDSFDNIWQNLKNGDYVSMPMKSSISGHYESIFEDIDSYNVIGSVEGSDAKLKKEYVIHSGHLDHLGITQAVNGDSINNGAHDNASGIACALEIARMYSTLKIKPKRSILFVFVTAEEKGLLGSSYFVANPTVPKANLIADVNTDMPTIIAPLESIAPLGAEHSSLQKTVEKAADLLGIKVEVDPEPSEGRFVRSDQYNFLKGGIPALHIKYGYKYSNPDLNLAEKVKIFREKNYHKPSDELNDSFVWSAGRKFAQLNFLVSYIIAQTPKRPTWGLNDFFNPKFYNR